MKRGIELVAQEREKQITKHGRTIESDVAENRVHQLSAAASILCLHEDHYGCNTVDDMVENHCPNGWDENSFERMLLKPYKERLVISAALITAEIDRIQEIGE